LGLSRVRTAGRAGGWGEVSCLHAPEDTAA